MEVLSLVGWSYARLSVLLLKLGHGLGTLPITLSLGFRISLSDLVSNLGV